jgi:hypothetical protein
MRALLSILVATAALGSSAASADQCQLVDSQVAARAAELARKSASVIELCEPCRGGVQRGPFSIDKVEIKNRQVEINGVAVDLAYTFLHTGGGEYTNLALAAGCPAHGVSRTIRSTQAPQRPVAPPRPRVPPMPRTPVTRVSAPEDLGGTWNVTIRGAVTTCAAMPAKRNATWTIAVAGGTLSLITDAGRELVAPLPSIDRQTLRVELKDHKQPQAGVLQVNQNLKDHFFGKLVEVERGSRATSCATVYDVMAARVP